MHADGQLVADFNSDTTRGCAPLAVRFTDISQGDPTSWIWDLGNGSNNITQQNPTAIYASPGNYTVKLVVKNADETDSVVKTQYIMVSDKPIVSFTASDSVGCVPINVQFTGQGDASIIKWEWDFGDGDTSTIQSPTHTYGIDGDFTVALRAENITGCSQVATRSSLIKIRPFPSAKFTYTAPPNCSAPIEVSFISSYNGNVPLTYQWSFGDGATSTERNPVHNFTQAGTYVVGLVTQNAFGCSDAVSDSIVIGSVTSDFLADDTVCIGSPVNFVNITFPSPASSVWSFGDGTTSTAISPVKTYNVPGTFVVQLVNNFGGCKDSITKSIVVTPKPSADFSFIKPAQGCDLPVTVSFSANSTAAASWSWSFGDGSTSTESNPSHAYTAYGTYSVKLKVATSNVCADSITKPNIVSVVPPQITGFNNLRFSGCAPYQHTFSARISSSEPVTTWLWNFGDGTTSTLQNPVHVYTNHGSYDVSLEITTQNGCKDTFVLKQAVTTSAKPEAAFTANPLALCASDSVAFTDNSTGVVNNWRWNFGDNRTSRVKNPFHHYRDTGYFNVRLIAGNNNCYDTITIAKHIYVKPPIARFTAGVNCDSPFIKQFTNKSVGAETSEWDFGDGTSSTLNSPVHTYASTGTYRVSLRVTNGTCSDLFHDTIFVINENPDFTIDNAATCRNAVTIFTATNINPVNIASYTWDFGDTSQSFTSTVPTLEYRYHLAGIFSPSLTITDNNGCKKSIRRDSIKTVFGPTAAFSAPANGCINNTISFVDQSQPYQNYSISSWVMNYGDGSVDSSTAPSFNHAYTTNGKYMVSLIITDNYGCTDTAYTRDSLHITGPSASFSISDSIACNNSVVRFINASQGDSLSYTWSFGNGQTSAATTPSHKYTAEGIYDISLVAKDKFGCADTLQKIGGVVIANARANFSMSDTLVSCPPAQISLFDSSLNIRSFTWDFDDGSFSDLKNPEHYFLDARTYFVKLRVSGFGSCSDSMVKKLVVKGPSGSISYSPLIRCVPATIDFKAEAINNTNFVWDFTDGITDSTTNFSVSHTYTNPGRYLPKLYLYDTISKCVVQVNGKDTITVTNLNSYIKQHNQIICDSNGVQLTDSSVVQFDSVKTYLWNFGDGITSDLLNPYHIYATAGNYQINLVVTTEGGCIDSSVTSSVRVVKTPDPIISSVPEICLQLPINFSGSLLQPDTSTVRWSWNFGNGATSDLATPPAQTYSVAGNYNVVAIATNSTGCVDSAFASLTVNALPDIVAGPDSTICLGQNLRLRVSGASTFTWESHPALSCTNCSNPVASPVDTLTRFIVSGKNAAGCENRDTVSVKVIRPFNVTPVPVTDTICVGESTTLRANGADNYTWYPSASLNNPTSSNPAASPDTTTTYTVIGRDYLNCFADTASLPVIVYPIPVFNIALESLSISAGNSVPLTTTSSPDITNWLWFPSPGLSCNTCQQPMATPTKTTTYTALVSNRGGCTAKDQVTIVVDCSNGNVFIPNTFSPNNDGMNDVFFPRGKGIVQIKLLQVFNRWGGLVFQKINFAPNAEQFGWNGTHNGQQLDAGVYIYKAEVICSNNQILPLSGDITLIR